MIPELDIPLDRLTFVSVAGQSGTLDLDKVDKELITVGGELFLHAVAGANGVLIRVRDIQIYGVTEIS